MFDTESEAIGTKLTKLKVFNTLYFNIHIHIVFYYTIINCLIGGISFYFYQAMSQYFYKL